jgi:hypothetical protein
MSLADFMLPQVSTESFRLTELANIVPPSRLFAGYDPDHNELLIDGTLSFGVEELTPDSLTLDYKSNRNIQFIESLPSAPIQPILWDMDDGRAFDSRVFTGKDLNVFQYNRRIGSRHAVLWRLSSYFEPSRGIGHGGWVEDGFQFEDKKPVVYWRGAISGSRWSDPYRRVGALSINSPAAFEELAPHFSRIKAVLLSEGSNSFDFKLTGPASAIEAKPWLDELGVLGDVVRPAQQLEHKYMLCPNGNDVASNLYWVLSTQSVAFKEECSYEVLPDYFLKPWVHYVPIANGFADLQEKFDYCESRPDMCKRIIENANHAYGQMIDPAIWKNAEVEVLDRLALM